MRLSGTVQVVAPASCGLTGSIVEVLQREHARVHVVAGDDPVGAVGEAARVADRLDGLVLTDAALATQWLPVAGEVLAQHGGGVVTTIVTSRALSGDTREPLETAEGGAALALTRWLATAHGRDGVRANAIAIPPSDLDADLVRRSTLLPRPFEPADLAALVVFLASADASFVTGQCMRCDGGLLAHLPHYATLVESRTTTTGS